MSFKMRAENEMISRAFSAICLILFLQMASLITSVGLNMDNLFILYKKKKASHFRDAFHCNNLIYSFTVFLSDVVPLPESRL